MRSANGRIRSSQLKNLPNVIAHRALVYVSVFSMDAFSLLLFLSVWLSAVAKSTRWKGRSTCFNVWPDVFTIDREIVQANIEWNNKPHKCFAWLDQKHICATHVASSFIDSVQSKITSIQFENWKRAGKRRVVISRCVLFVRRSSVKRNFSALFKSALCPCTATTHCESAAYACSLVASNFKAN